MANDNKRNRIGALWKRKSKDGKTDFMTGQLKVDGNQIDIVVFKSLEKPTTKHPDAIIYLSEPREGGKPAARPAAAAVRKPAAPAAAAVTDGDLI